MFSRARIFALTLQVLPPLPSIPPTPSLASVPPIPYPHTVVAPAGTPGYFSVAVPGKLTGQIYPIAGGYILSFPGERPIFIELLPEGIIIQ